MGILLEFGELSKYQLQATFCKKIEFWELRFSDLQNLSGSLMAG